MKKILVALLVLGVLFYFFWTCLPKPLFLNPTSTVLEDRNGELLGALIAKDGQWRFPESRLESDKFAIAIVQFEDHRFYQHLGFDPVALARAAWLNIKSKKIKSGGSTLSMQVIRLSRKGKKRSLWQKAIELIQAIRLECSYSKSEILSLYSSHAPFGNNVVGLDAASWRYFGRSAKFLSWGEAATLAVLPNSPSLVHLGRNRDLLLKKRNKLLDKLCNAGKIDSTTCALSKAEPLPGKPLPLPHHAPHLLVRSYLEHFNNVNNPSTLVQSTLLKALQIQANAIVSRHHEVLSGNGINNAAALIADAESGEVLAYVGNIYTTGKAEFENDVDIITAPRSTGSILKPFLYAAMLGDGALLPNTLIPDIPTQIAGYSPENFNKEFDGAVPAKRALERSLNVPAVRMLRSYSYSKFHILLKQLGMSTLSQTPDHYGLSLILGGAEGTLWDIGGMYAGMTRTLNHFQKNEGQYDGSDFHPLTYMLPISNNNKTDFPKKINSPAMLSAAAIWCTFNAMEEVSRPDMEMNWKEFNSSQKIAWKTGTSYGFRDGWAIGCTKKYVVAVWVGNADGEGRPGLIGVSTAAPIMFDLFKLLATNSWFDQPYAEMELVPVCKKSGYRALDICETIDSMWIPSAGLKTAPCPYHQLIHLDLSGKWRVGSDCEATSNMLHKSWFVLPPAQEWFYKSKNKEYQSLPPFRKDCQDINKSAVMEFIYPKKSTQIYVPIELDGKSGKAIFEVAHRTSGTSIYWHLDEHYLGVTKDFHQMALSPDAGKHVIVLIDQNGERLEQYFEVLMK